MHSILNMRRLHLDTGLTRILYAAAPLPIKGNLSTKNRHPQHSRSLTDLAPTSQRISSVRMSETGPSPDLRAYSGEYERDRERNESMLAEIRKDDSVLVAYAYIALILRAVTEAVTYRKLMSSVALLFAEVHEPVLTSLGITAYKDANGGYSPRIKKWWLNTVRRAFEQVRDRNFFVLKPEKEKVQVIITRELDVYVRQQHEQLGHILTDGTIRDFQSRLRQIMGGDEEKIIAAVGDHCLNETVRDYVIELRKLWRIYSSPSASDSTRKTAKSKMLELIVKFDNALNLSEKNRAAYYEGVLVASTFKCVLGSMGWDLEGRDESIKSIQRLFEICKSNAALAAQIRSALEIVAAAEKNDSKSLERLCKEGTVEWGRELAYGLLQLRNALITDTSVDSTPSQKQASENIAERRASMALGQGNARLKVLTALLRLSGEQNVIERGGWTDVKEIMQKTELNENTIRSVLSDLIRDRLATFWRKKSIVKITENGKKAVIEYLEREMATLHDIESIVDQSGQAKAP
jgi:hypothetical protein